MRLTIMDDGEEGGEDGEWDGCSEGWIGLRSVVGE